jgi:hypothetical protein
MKIDDGWVEVMPPKPLGHYAGAVAGVDEAPDMQGDTAGGKSLVSVVAGGAGALVATVSVAAVAYYLLRIETAFLWQRLASSRLR